MKLARTVKPSSSPLPHQESRDDYLRPLGLLELWLAASLPGGWRKLVRA